MNLPEEVLEKIVYYSNSRIDVALKRSPNARKLLFDGGYCNVLKTILEFDADLKSIFYIKKHVPALLAVFLAIDTKTNWIAKRVCIMWDMWISDSAFRIAWNRGFIWGVEHIKPISTLTPQMYNRVYFELGLLDKIDLTVKKPFRHIYPETNDYIKAKHLSFTPLSDAFDKGGFFWLHLIHGNREQVYKLLDEDTARDISVAEDIYYSLSLDHYSFFRKNGIEEKFEYKLPIDLSKEYKNEYRIDKKEVERNLFKLRRIDIWEYYDGEFTDIHRAFLAKDSDTLNSFLVKRRLDTLDILLRYGLHHHQYQEICSNANVKLDANGKWLGLTESPTMDDQGYDITYINWGESFSKSTLCDAKIRNMTTDNVNLLLSESSYQYEAIPEIVLKFIKFKGVEILDDITCTIPLVSFFVEFKFDTVIELIKIAVERGYKVERLAECSDKDDPQVYIQRKSIYFEDHLIELESSYVFEDYKIIQNQIILACRDYYHNTS